MLPRPPVHLAVALAVALACGPEPAAEEAEHPTVSFQEEVAPALPGGYSQEYEFSDDWFSRNISTWQEIFASWVGRPDLRYLEVGVYEGRSFLWMLENVLTHPTSRATAVDIFVPPEVYERFLSNVEKSGQAQRVTTIQGYSQAELRKLPLESFDIVYIDGSHTADDVLVDAVLSWGLLRSGGLLVFDDFLWNGQYYTGRDSHLPFELTPGPAITAFMQTHINYAEVVHEGYQMVLRKRENPCSNKSICSPIGRYNYHWKGRQLLEREGGAVVPLSAEERRALEEILWDRRLARGGLFLEAELRERPAVQELARRLGIALVE